MAVARQQAEWFRVGLMTAWIVNNSGFTKKPISPLTIIPEEFRPPPAPPRQRTPEEVESDNRLAWAAMDRYFSQGR